MANPAVLQQILHKLTIINAELGSTTLAAEIVAVNALVVVADAAADALATVVGSAAGTDIKTDIAAIQTTLDNVGT
jgi:hypothetical protein